MNDSLTGKDRLAYCEKLIYSPHLKLLNGSELLSLASKFNKIEKEFRKKNQERLVPKKIATLASYTTHHFLQILKLFFYQQGIAPEFYEGVYNGITMELMDPDSTLFSFKPDMLLLLTFHADIKSYPALFSAPDTVEDEIFQTVDFYKNLWKITSSLENCQTFQTLFVKPLERHLGNLDANYLFSPANFLTRLNLELIKSRPPHVTFIDLDYTASFIGKNKWFDESNYFLSKQGFSLDAAGIVAYQISRAYTPYIGKIRKCLVLDLDNTLWGGVIGDDGLEGINLNPNHPVGEAYLAFQKYIKKLKDRGVILAVCSKNDEKIAKIPFEAKHFDMPLKLNDIACFIANWNDKATNLHQIASQLNIGLDSLVFVDDNIAERELVRQFLPEVEVIDLPADPALYMRALDQSLSFEWGQLTQEDLSRSETYIADQKRFALYSQTHSYDDYLKSLEMEAIVDFVGPLELPRFGQLINKSNQFNLRTQRYPESSLEQMKLSSDHWALVYIDFKDRFDHYGIISSIIIRKEKEKAFIDTWVMSCRVLKRGIEHLVFNSLHQIISKWKCRWLVGEFIPTNKNNLVKNLLPDLGFEKVPSNWFPKTDSESVLYRFDLEKDAMLPHWIEIKKGVERPIKNKEIP